MSPMCLVWKRGVGDAAPYAVPLERRESVLDKRPESRYNEQANGVWRSLVSRLVRVQETSGSNPDTPTKETGIRIRGFRHLLG